MSVSGPLAHIGANLGDDGLGGAGMDGIDIGEVYPGQSVECRAGIISRLIFAVGVALARGF